MRCHAICASRAFTSAGIRRGLADDFERTLDRHPDKLVSCEVFLTFAA
jgi:hypothetical protein